MAATVSTATAHPLVADQEPGTGLVSIAHIAARTSDESNSAAASDWASLTRDHGTLPCVRPDWVAAYTDHFARKAELQVFEAKTATGLIGALPLIRERAKLCGVPVRRLRPACSLVSPDRTDIACVPGTETAAAGAIWSAIKAQSNWDVIELVDLPDWGPGAHLVELAAGEGYHTGSRLSRRTPYLLLDKPIDVIGDTNTEFRARVRQRLRKVRALGKLELRRYETIDSDAWLQFLQMEDSGWKGSGGTSILSTPAETAYFSQIARCAEVEGNLAIYSLELDGRPIAMHFGVHIGDYYSVPKAAYDESMREYGPGHLLIWFLLQDLQERGTREFDFLGNAMDWKTRWTKQMHIHNRVHIFNHTAAGLAAARLRYSILPPAHKSWLQIRSRLQRPEVTA